MRFKKLLVDIYPSAKVGDFIEVGDRVFKVVGFTDAGLHLLVQVPGEYQIYKVLLTKEKR
jgi:hypothetical protein